MILALVCIAPVAASYLAYYTWTPATTRNYGELIPPTPIAELGPAAAPASTLSPLRGKWVMVVVDGPDCQDACREKLWQIRQLRLTQGKEMDRVARAWLVTGEGQPAADLLAEYAGTELLRDSDVPALAAALAGRSPKDHIFVIDPLGNLMMQFPKDPDLSRVKKDLSLLLKVSQIG
ncbi:MAG: cytochrome C oxidase subunit I [Alphaproteobacteria bacterium]